MINEYTFKIHQNYIENNSLNGPSVVYDIYQLFISIKNRVNYNGYGEMITFVNTYITDLLSSAVDKNPKALKILSDKDFLTAMNTIDLSLSKDYINRFNRVYRAYMINPAKNAIYDQQCANLMYVIAVKLNKENINKIITKDLMEHNALWIIINRYSSTDERRNIRRAVRAMQHINRNIMDEDMIIRIFTKLFQDQMTNLFCAVMTDKFDTFDDYNEQIVYSSVNIAILRILNTMDYDDIKDILLIYATELKESGTDGRFSLNTISPDDYRKIVDAKDEVEKIYGVKIY